MSKKSAKPAGPVTRRQQVAALRAVKGAEIAVAVATSIREIVREEVEHQLKTITATMLDCIDRVIDLENPTHDSDSDSGSEREEALPVQPDAQVAPRSGSEGTDRGGEDGAEGPTSG